MFYDNFRFLKHLYLKYLLLLVFLTISINVAQSQVVYRDDGALTDSAELRLLYDESIKVLDSTNRTGLHIERLDILEVGNDKYLLPNGAMSVYKWRNNTWHNICKGANRGFNYGNKAFVHKGKIYCWGGYGFWRGHGMLIVFQEDLGEWELLPFTGELDFMYGWQTPTGLFAFNADSSIEINIDDQNIRESPEGLRNDFPILEPLHWYEYDFKNYYLIYITKAWLIEKSTGQIYESDVVAFRHYVKNGKGMFRIFGDSVTYFKGDMDHRFDLSVKDELQFFNKKEQNSDKQFYVIFFVSLALMSTIVPMIIYRKRKRKKSELITSKDEPHSWDNKYLEALLLQQGNILSVDELDTILEIIDVIPAETQRFKRSNLIKEINRLYCARYDVDLIFRKQDVEDGRKYVYQICNE